MRTKTLILSALAGAFCSASLMAQVYSQNSVGYINVTIPPGFSMIANQLNTTNNNLSPLLDSQLSTGNYDSLTFFKYSHSTSNYITLSVDSFSSLTPYIPWDQAAATNTTLNPGEATFVNSGYTTNVTLTFVGTVLTGTLTNTFYPGFNMVSSQVPRAGRLDADLGMTEVDNDIVFIYNNAIHNYESFTGDSFDAPAPPWDVVNSTNQYPTVTVGQGFFYKSGEQTNWVVNFSVN